MSQRKSLREKVPSSRSLASRTGICGDPVADQPTEETASSISGVGREPFRLDPETPFGAIEHDLCRVNLVVGPRRRRLNVNDHRVLNVDEIIKPIPELHTLVGLGGPGRAGVAW